MKAIIHKQYGPPEVAKLTEVPKPVPGENEVLIKVHYATVNRTDCGFRSAEYFISRFWSGLFRPKYQTLGNEFSGVIEMIGSKVKNFSVGDRVFGYNDEHFGAHAEFMIMAEDEAMVHMPVALSFKEAAPIFEGAHYALCDIRAAKVQAGDNVLVYGATGAIGSAAVQLLKYFGANVTAVCSTPHLEMVKSLGADFVLDYTREDFTKVNQKFSFIFDAVGKTSIGKCRRIMSDSGVYISTELGEYGQNVFLALIPRFLVKKRVLFPLPLTKKEDMIFLRDLAVNGNFKPVIDREFTLDQIVEAYSFVETGQKVGNVLIRMA
jgi:NADPH:quinone reductase-like Zn-dependent oxidoreductase